MAPQEAQEPQPQPATEEPPAAETHNWQAPSQWNVNKNETFQAPLQNPNVTKGPFHNSPPQNGSVGGNSTPNATSEEIPNEAEIDDFLNDA